MKLTRGARIAKDSGHVVRAKDIIEGGPDSYSLHIEISVTVGQYDIYEMVKQSATFVNNKLQTSHESALLLL